MHNKLADCVNNSFLGKLIFVGSEKIRVCQSCGVIDLRSERRQARL